MFSRSINKFSDYEAANLWVGPLYFRVWKGSSQPKYQFIIEFRVFLNITHTLRWPNKRIVV